MEMCKECKHRGYFIVGIKGSSNVIAIDYCKKSERYVIENECDFFEEKTNEKIEKQLAR